MKLAALRTASRDGQLLVVSRDLTRAVDASTISPTMQSALDDWDNVSGKLNELYDRINSGLCPEAFDLDTTQLAAPLPRAYQWLDGSAFNNHGKLMARAFGFDANKHDRSIPLIYQGGSDDFIGPRDDIVANSEDDGIDFEGELAVITRDVPRSVTAADAEHYVLLAAQLNDVSLRTYAPLELRTGFGWIHSKPSTAFAPTFITLDELGDAWHGGRIHLPLHVSRNGGWFGHPNATEMSFSFYDLIAYVARTRRLGAGTIVGSGTVSNAERSAGSTCITEQRAIEMIEHGEPVTGYMKFGDRVRMEMRDSDDGPLFGAIDQKVVKA